MPCGFGMLYGLAFSELKRRLRIMLKSKLDGGNLVKAINNFAAVVRYSAGIVKWTTARKF